MGAWGEGPFDNDSALDWFYKVEGTVELVLDRAEKHGTDGREEELRAAAEVALLLRHSSGRMEDMLPRFVAALLEIRQGDWVSRWNDRRARSRISSTSRSLRWAVRTASRNI